VRREARGWNGRKGLGPVALPAVQAVGMPLGRSFRGCSPAVKQLALKGNGAGRHRPPTGRAWQRGGKVSPNEAGFDLRETTPLSHQYPV
jgi:hypothetical protein